MPLDALESSRGRVLDLSRGGMRVRCSRRVKGRIVVAIGDGDDKVVLWAEVRWARRVGLRSHDIGLRFLGVTPEQGRTLTRIAINNRPRRKLAPSARVSERSQNAKWVLYAQLGGPSAGLSLL